MTRHCAWMFLGLAAITQTRAPAQPTAVPVPVGITQAPPATTNRIGAAGETRVYMLRPGDVVQVSVYQEEDMSAKARLEKDGTILLPFLGKVRIGGKTLEEASALVRDLLAKEYLVHPQVSVAVAEFVKRRFTILGQVQRPGSYEMPTEEPLSLLQAIATAGGFTRLGAPTKITVQRMVGTSPRTFKLDAEAMSRSPSAKPFEIEADDSITVGERLL